MSLTARYKRIIFIASLIATMLLQYVGLFFQNGLFVNAIDPVTEREITLTKIWANDEPTDRPSTITAYVSKTSSTLRSGSDLNTKMISLASNVSNIKYFKKATAAEYQAVTGSLNANNEVQASGEPTYMWYANNTVYYYSEADNIYLNENSSKMFNSMSMLEDISGASGFITSYVTDMNRMFQDSLKISDLSPLAGWDTGNVTDMTFMFGGNFSSGSCVGGGINITDVSSLANWDIQKVTSTNNMFKCNKSLTNIDALAGWNLISATNLSLMFNQTGVTSTAAVKDWNVKRVTDFTKMFGGAPITAYVNFVERPGTWITSGNDQGGYTPSGPVTPDPIVTTTKVKTPDQASCAVWNKTNDANGVWTCKLVVSNDGSIYSKAWEDAIIGYRSSASIANPTTIVGDAATITNTLAPTDKVVTLQKIVTGDAGDSNKDFSFNAQVYDENGNLVPSYSSTFNLRHGGSVVAFMIPEGYSYEITEATSDYTTSFVIKNTKDGSEIGGRSLGTSTGIITPATNHTVVFTNNKTTNPTKEITIVKKWNGDTPATRPNSITAYIKKTSSTLITGKDLNVKMKQLAGNTGASVYTADTKIAAIKQATKSQYEAKKSTLTSDNEVQSSGEKTYMWYDGGTIYYYSEADNIYMNADSMRAFNTLTSLVDISGLSNLNTTYVTNMAFMFQDDKSLSDLSPLSSWDVGNVVSMRFMFGSNNTSIYMIYSDISPLSNWNTQSVTDMNSMFKGSGYLIDLTPLARWNVENVADMTQMFNRVGIAVSTFPITEDLVNWRPVRVGGTYANLGNNGSPASGSFSMMFANTYNINSNYSKLPKFVDKNGNTGTWSSVGTYTLTSGPESGSVTITKKTPSEDQQTCTTWDKTNEADGIWTCTLTVSNDSSVYKAWEDVVASYDGSAYAANPVMVAGNVATITNTLLSHTVTLKKVVTGNTAALSDSFDFSIEVRDVSGNVVNNYIATQNLKHGDEVSFIIPQGYSYQISETDTDYAESYNITKTSDGSSVVVQTSGLSTGVRTPSFDETVIFVNNREKTPLTGVLRNEKPYNMLMVIGVSGTAGFLSFSIFGVRRKIRQGLRQRRGGVIMK